MINANRHLIITIVIFGDVVIDVIVVDVKQNVGG